MRVLSRLLLGAAVALAASLNPSPAEGETAEATLPAAPARASVRFVSPAASEVVYGPTTLRVKVVPPAGTRVKSVEFIVDGKRVGRDASPPFESLWDAGTSLASHVLRAIASFSDGTTQEDAVTTRRIAFVQHELVEGMAIDHIELLVSVTDRHGAPVRGLPVSAFEVREGGSPVGINTFKSVEGDGVPLSVAVLVDRSGSMKFRMMAWADACVALLSVLRPTDQLRVAAFADEMVVLQDFTHDATALQASLAAIGSAGGSTRLYRALFETVRDLRDLPGRKALIVLTDGIDTEMKLPGGPGSSRAHPMTDETIRMAARSGITIIAILPGPTSWDAVQDIAMQTGGYCLYPSKDLRALMRRLGEGLLASYVVGYDSERPSDTSRKRAVKVSVKREADESLEVRTAVGAYSSVDALTFLKDDINFGNTSQKARAVREIGRLESPEGAPIVRKALGDPLPAVRASAVAAVAERGDVETLPEIGKLVGDPDTDVRQAAFDALVRFGARAIPYLQDGARAGRATRPAALRALGETGDASVMPDLTAALREGDCDARAAAVEGLRSMAALNDGARLTLSPRPDSLAAGAMGLLVGTLGDECAPASEWAAVVLGRIGHPDAYSRLLGIVRAVPDSPRLVEALAVLPSYPTRESLDAIEKQLDSFPPVAQAARGAAALLYERSAVKGDILPMEVALGRLALLGGEEALAGFRRLSQQPTPEGEGKTWHRRIEATIKKLEESH